MKAAGLSLLLCLWAIAGLRVSAAEGSWQTALSAMPLPDSPALTRSNAIRLIVSSFTSNGVVRALVVLPGVVDDFHLIHRDVPLPAINVRNLADAIESLIKFTPLRVRFEHSRLLLHTSLDRLAPVLRVEHAETAARLRERRGLSAVQWIDTRWALVQPILRTGLGLGVWPNADSDAAGHFERLNLAAHGLTDLEMLDAIALTMGTQVVIEQRRVRFERP